jgi:hypothetical protein
MFPLDLDKLTPEQWKPLGRCYRFRVEDPAERPAAPIRGGQCPGGDLQVTARSSPSRLAGIRYLGEVHQRQTNHQ